MEHRVLTEDLDLVNEYFFKENSTAPVSGVLHAGGELDVEWRKSTASYVSFSTVLNDSRLEAVSRPVPSE